MKLLALLVSLLTASPLVAAPAENRTAHGVLMYFPETVQSPQAWYGHNFMVGDTPIQPTAAFPAKKLLTYVGKTITVKGRWFKGTAFVQDAQQILPMPMDTEQTQPVMRGDGILVEQLHSD